MCLISLCLHYLMRYPIGQCCECGSINELYMGSICNAAQQYELYHRPQPLDELTFDLSLTFTLYIPLKKMRLI